MMREYPLEIARWQAYMRQPLPALVIPQVPAFCNGERSPYYLTNCIAPAVGLIALQGARVELMRVQLLAALAYLDDGDVGLSAHLNPLSGKPFTFEKTDSGFRLRADIPGQKKPAELTVGDPAKIDVPAVVKPEAKPVSPVSN